MLRHHHHHHYHHYNSWHFHCAYPQHHQCHHLCSIDVQEHNRHHFHHHHHNNHDQHKKYINSHLQFCPSWCLRQWHWSSILLNSFILYNARPLGTCSSVLCRSTGKVALNFCKTFSRQATPFSNVFSAPKKILFSGQFPLSQLFCPLGSLLTCIRTEKLSGTPFLWRHCADRGEWIETSFWSRWKKTCECLRIRPHLDVGLEIWLHPPLSPSLLVCVTKIQLNHREMISLHSLHIVSWLNLLKRGKAVKYFRILLEDSWRKGNSWKIAWNFANFVKLDRNLVWIMKSGKRNVKLVIFTKF